MNISLLVYIYLVHNHSSVSKTLTSLLMKVRLINPCTDNMMSTSYIKIISAYVIILQRRDILSAKEIQLQRIKVQN